MEVKMKTFTKITMIVMSTFLMAGKCSEEKQVGVEKPPLVLVIGIDNSATMDGYPLWTTIHTELVCKALNQRNTDVCICLKTIGNPNNEGFKRLYLKKVPKIDNNATMSVRAKQRKDAERIKSENLELITQFVTEINLDRKHENKTCINLFCSEASILLSEPQFNQGFQKIVVLYSDGLNDPLGNNIIQPINATFPDAAQLNFIGWKNTDKIKHNGVSNEFSDIDGFIQFINSNI